MGRENCLSNPTRQNRAPFESAASVINSLSERVEMQEEQRACDTKSMNI